MALLLATCCMLYAAAAAGASVQAWTPSAAGVQRSSWICAQPLSERHDVSVQTPTVIA